MPLKLHIQPTFYIPQTAISISKGAKPLGVGASGSVVSATWTKKDGSKEPVAVKRLMLPKPTNEQKRTVEKEIAIFSQCNHPGVIKLYGVCVCEEEIWVVMELANGGSLHSKLEKENYSWEVKWKWATEVAAAVEYLHAIGITHRDIKSPNILFVNHQLKISDFGMATAINLASGYKTSGDGHVYSDIGTHNWLAPESVTAHATFSTASDIYSLGVVLWEIASRELPYAHLTKSTEVLRAILQGPPPIAEHLKVPISFSSIIQQCCQKEAEDRPDAKSVHAMIASAPKN